jgi:YVTN family beta-propeller protein
VADNNSLEWDFTSKTFSLWTKIGPSLENDDQKLLEKYDRGGTYTGYFMDVFINGGLARVNLLNNGSVFLLSSTTSITDYNWHHVAFTFDGSSKRGKLYIDGVNEAEGVATSIHDLSNSTSLKIGANDILNHKVNGTLDDLRIYNRAFSEAEIDELYIEGLTPEDLLVNMINDINDLGIPELDDVLVSLQNALAELNKTPPDNKSAVSILEEAVDKIADAVKELLLDSEQAKQLMDKLVEVARKLAVEALDKAIALVGDPTIIADAQQALDEGDVYRSKEEYKDAFKSYEAVLDEVDDIIQDCNKSDLICTPPNRVIATIPVVDRPGEIIITPDGSHAYLADHAHPGLSYGHTVSVIRTSDNLVIETIPVGSSPYAITVTPDGNHVYVANANSHTVSVIRTSDNSVIETIPVGSQPYGVTVTSDGNHGICNPYFR